MPQAGLSQSPRLRDFYRSYVKWATAGCQDSGSRTEGNPIGYFREDGLCSSLQWFCFEYLTRRDFADLIEEMQDQLKGAGLSTQFPFNVNGIDYGNEAKIPFGRLKNKVRWQWLLDHAKM